MDSAKVDIISNIPREALVEEDGHSPSVKTFKSFLGMMFFYQSFIPGCSLCQFSVCVNSRSEEERTDWSDWERCWHVQEVDCYRLESCMSRSLS